MIFCFGKMECRMWKRKSYEKMKMLKMTKYIFLRKLGNWKIFSEMKFIGWN